jgi:hypothetical protein
MPLGMKMVRCVYILPPPTWGVIITSNHAFPGKRTVERSRSTVAGSRASTLQRRVLSAALSTAFQTSPGAALVVAVRTSV